MVLNRGGLTSFHSLKDRYHARFKSSIVSYLSFNQSLNRALVPGQKQYCTLGI